MNNVTTFSYRDKMFEFSEDYLKLNFCVSVYAYSYATSFVLERQTGTAFEKINDAGRRGRQGDNCREIYVECSGI